MIRKRLTEEWQGEDEFLPVITQDKQPLTIKQKIKRYLSELLKSIAQQY